MKFKVVSIFFAGSFLMGMSLPGQAQDAQVVIYVNPGNADDYSPNTNVQSLNVTGLRYALSVTSLAQGQGADSAGISPFTNNTSGSITLTNPSTGATAVNVESAGADNNNGNGGTAGNVQVFNYGSITVNGIATDDISDLAVGSIGGSGTGGTGQGGGTSGTSTVHEYGALLAGTAAVPLQGNGNFRGLDAFSIGGNAGMGENGYDGSASSSVTVIGHQGGNVSAYWQDANTTGTYNTFAVHAYTAGGQGGSVGANADSGKNAGVGGSAGEANVSLTDENITLVSNVGGVTYTGTLTDVLGAAVGALSIGGNGGTGGTGSTNSPSDAGDGGASTPGMVSSVAISNTNINVTGDFIGGVLGQNTGGNGGNGGVQTNGYAQDHSYAGNGGTAGDMVLTVSGTTGTNFYIATHGIYAPALEVGNRGGTGGLTYDYSPFSGGVVGNGGNGGGAGWTTVSLAGPLEISTDGSNSAGVLAYSVGGNGGLAGNLLSSTGSSGTAGNGGSGGVAAYVTVTLSNGVKVSTTADDSSGVMALSIGGNGAAGGEFKGAGDGDAGNGGNGGSTGPITVTTDSSSSIATMGDGSSGIVALSFSGAGAAGGPRDEGFGSSGTGGAGGATGIITLNNAGTITTQGAAAYGIFAEGSSGAGGDSGSTASVFSANIPAGASSGAVGTINLINSGSITTVGSGSYGMFGLSLSGGGGAGGASMNALTSLGGDGGIAAPAGTVTLASSGYVTTSGSLTPAILLASIGGGGGDGGNGTGILVVGGGGAGGGTGGTVSANLDSGLISTYGLQSIAVLAQSIGGGGGNAGNATATSVNVALAIGGTGGAGGNGGAVTINDAANISTYSSKSAGIVAQSVGGGGGNGGAAYALDVGLLISGAVTLGGTGGFGGNGSDVTVATTGGRIWTGQVQSTTTTASSATATSIPMPSLPTEPTNLLPTDAIGILAQSIGGGGGNGGSTWAEAVAIGLPLPVVGTNVAASVSYSQGGNGGVAGNGGVVQVNVGNGTQIITQGQGSDAVLAQSIGGGGGNGGDSSAMASTIDYSRAASAADVGTYSVDAAITLGGTGSSGGNGGNVNITAGDALSAVNQVVTYGDYSNALTAQSIGGGGGNAGMGSGTTADYGESRGVSVIDNLGGQGGLGGTGANASVTLTANGSLLTYGSDSIGVLAQSIGGGGGTSQGGMYSLSGEFSINNVLFVPEGSSVYQLGITGGAGGAGGLAGVNIYGTVQTLGDASIGVLVQSVGGGGGVAGSAGSDASADNPILGGLFDYRKFITALAEDYIPFKVSTSGNLGSDTTGAGGDGGFASAYIQGSVQTQGDWAPAVMVQSIGAGGGLEGSASATGSQAVMNLSLGVGGNGQASGEGGNASVTLNGAKIVTGVSDGSSGFSSFGILVQSVGGGGGFGADGSDSATGTIRVGSSFNPSDPAPGRITDSGGNVMLSGSGTVVTYGEAAHGVVLQSIGGGGGIGGAGSSKTPLGNTGIEVFLSGFASDPGKPTQQSANGGSVTATNLVMNIQTHGDNAFGLLAQSIGGGGGLGAVVAPKIATIPTVNANDTLGGTVNISLASGSSITTSGLNSYGIFAQSVGGGGGIAAYSVSNNWTTSGSFAESVAAGSGGTVTVSLAKGSSIVTTGTGAHGIVVQSVGDGGGVSYEDGLLVFGSVGESSVIGTAGTVTVDVEGSIQVSGTGAFGVMAQSTTSNPQGQGGDINITVGGSVVSSNSSAIYVLNGGTNTLTINPGALVEGFTAVEINSQSKLSITNSGTLSGSIVGPTARGESVVAPLSAATDSPVAPLATSAVSLVTVENQGLFLMGSTVQANVQNDGVLRIGTGTTAYGQSEISGNYTQGAGGQMVFNVNFASGQSDFLTIDGDATLAGKLRLQISNLLPAQRVPAMEIKGAITDDLTVGSSALFNFDLTKDAASNIYYVEATTSNFAALSASFTPNQRAVAQYFDNVWKSTGTPLPGNVFAALDNALNANPNGLATFLDQFSPVNFASFASTTAFNNQAFTFQQIDSYLANHRGADGGFVSSQGGIDYSGLTMINPNIDPGLQTIRSRLVAWSPAPSAGLLSDSSSLVDGGMDMKDMAANDSASANKWNVFVNGSVILAQDFSNAPAGIPYAHATTGAAQIGADYRISRTWLTGVTLGYGHTHATVDNLGSNVTVNTYSPGVYASYSDKGWYANGIASYGFANYSQNRNIAIGAFNGTANSSPGGDQIAANLDGGYDFHKGNWTFGPTLGLGYTHLDVDGYTESGLPGANLAVASQQADSLRSRLGGQFRYAIKSGSTFFTPHFSASWQHEYLNQSRGITSQFSGVSAGSFVVNTASASQNSVLADLGLDAQLDKTWTVFTDYTVQAGQSNYFGQSVQAGVKIGF